MKTLLVPCDDSKSAMSAVRHAASEAAGSSAQVHLLHVIEPMTPVTLSEAFSAPRLDERFPPQAAAALAPAVAVLTNAGVDHALHCRFGRPAPEIAAYAQTCGCDEVIMGTRGGGTVANLVLGSVATALVKQIDMPMTLVKENSPQQVDRHARQVLVPFDGSENAMRALGYAAGLVRDRRAVRLALLHVLDPTTSRAHRDLSPEALTRLAPDEFVRVLRPARAFLEAYAIPHEVHCRVGEPAVQIAGYLAQAGNTAVVMGTRGLGAIGNLLVGSVASRVVYYVNVPVTLIK